MEAKHMTATGWELTEKGKPVSFYDPALLLAIKNNMNKLTGAPEEFPKLERQTPIEEVYIRTYTGGKFHVFAPKPDEVSILDIAHALSQQCRFTGHTRKFYSVAQHSVLVARQSKCWGDQYELKGLLHDAAEAYLVDLPTPIKRNVTFASEWRGLDARITDAVHGAFGIQYHGASHYIKGLDHRMLLTEQRDLMNGADLNEMNHGWYNREWRKPFDFTIEPWSSEQAEEEFLKDFKKYMGMRKTEDAA